MNQKIAEKVAHEVQEAIRELDHLYVVITTKANREREVKIRVKGGHYGN